MAWFVHAPDQYRAHLSLDGCGHYAVPDRYFPALLSVNFSELCAEHCVRQLVLSVVDGLLFISQVSSAIRLAVHDGNLRYRPSVPPPMKLNK